MESGAGRLFVLGMLVALVGGCAGMGGPALPPQGMARYHWEAIARSDVGMTTIQYGPNAVLEWVGGPLQGRYAGPTAIAEVWTKFFIAQGSMELEVSNVQEKQEAGRQTVTARTIFKGRRAVPVDYTLTFEGNQIVAEAWRVSP